MAAAPGGPGWVICCGATGTTCSPAQALPCCSTTSRRDSSTGSRYRSDRRSRLCCNLRLLPFGKPPLGGHRRTGSRTDAGPQLPVDLVGDVAGGEDALDAGVDLVSYRYVAAS